MRWITSRSPRLIGFLLIFLALVVATQTVALAATFQRNGKAVTAVRTVLGDDFIERNIFADGNAYKNMPGMATNVVVPSGQRAVLLITFAGESNCYSGADEIGYCLVRVLVDGQPAAPGEVVFDSRSDSGTTSDPNYAWETNSMQFVVGPLGPGTHNVKVQWRTTGLISFWMGKRTLTVLRSKV